MNTVQIRRSSLKKELIRNQRGEYFKSTRLLMMENELKKGEEYMLDEDSALLLRKSMVDNELLDELREKELMNKLTNMLNEVEYEGNIKSIDRITICKLVGSVCCNMLLDDLTVKEKQGLVRLALRAGDYLQTRLLMEVNDDKEKDQNNSEMECIGLYERQYKMNLELNVLELSHWYKCIARILASENIETEFFLHEEMFIERVLDLLKSLPKLIKRKTYSSKESCILEMSETELNIFTTIWDILFPLSIIHELSENKFQKFLRIISAHRNVFQQHSIISLPPLYFKLLKLYHSILTEISADQLCKIGSNINIYMLTMREHYISVEDEEICFEIVLMMLQERCEQHIDKAFEQFNWMIVQHLGFCWLLGRYDNAVCENISITKFSLLKFIVISLFYESWESEFLHECWEFLIDICLEATKKYFYGDEIANKYLENVVTALEILIILQNRRQSVEKREAYMNYIRSVGGELLLEEILDCRQVEVDSECSERVKSIPRLVRVLVEEIEELGDGRMEKE